MLRPPIVSTRPTGLPSWTLPLRQQELIPTPVDIVAVEWGRLAGKFEVVGKMPMMDFVREIEAHSVGKQKTLRIYICSSYGAFLSPLIGMTSVIRGGVSESAGAFIAINHAINPWLFE